MDANRGDYQKGWDPDQFPNNINELTETMLVIYSTVRVFILQLLAISLLVLSK